MTRTLLGLALGLALGILAGWFLFGDTEPPPPREVVRTVYLPPEPDEERDPYPAPRPEGDDPGGATTLDGAALLAASHEELARLAVRRELTFAPGAVEALLERVDRARDERDWNAFRALLSLLGRAGTPEAQAKLVAIMGDPEVGFPHAHLGRQFFDWLKESEAPGIAPAVRARLEREMQEAPGSLAVQRGWLALLAQHGGPADLEWIEAQRATPGGDREAIEAFVAASGRPEVAQRVERLFREREQRWFSGHLRVVAQENPELALQLLEAGLREPKRGEERDLARVYGDTVAPARVEQARALLMGLTGPEQRIAAVYAVERMKRRGLDTSGMESVVQAPVVALERYASNPNASELFEARYAIERNPVTWSERAAKALETAADHAPPAQASGLRQAAQRVRAGIGSPDSEWVTR